LTYKGLIFYTPVQKASSYQFNSIQSSGLGVEKVSFLTYHERGTSKTSRIGPIPRDYQAEAPSDDHVAHLIEIMAKNNVPASVVS